MSTLNIDESPVTCGEPARRTNNRCTYRNTRARDGVWDTNVVVNSGIVVRFDLINSVDVRDLGSGESRVKESRVESRFGSCSRSCA